MNTITLSLLLLSLMLSLVAGFVQQSSRVLARAQSGTYTWGFISPLTCPLINSPFGFCLLTIGTTLFAHHPQKKIIKKKMDRRPKKHRPSDIHRNNVNFNKCITKIPGAPTDYTIVAEQGKLWCFC